MDDIISGGYTVCYGKTPYTSGDDTRFLVKYSTSLSERIVRIFPITTRGERAMPEEFEHLYEISDWESAGLRRTSWVDVRVPYEFPLEEFLPPNVEVRGDLTEEDSENLDVFVSNYILYGDGRVGA